MIDENVDARIVGVLHKAGHEAWTIPDGNLSAADDETVAVYAHDKSAAVVTHDHEFSAWRRKRCIGQHIWLRCEEPDGPEVLTDCMPEIVAVLERRPNVFCEVGKNSLKFSYAWT